MEGNMKKINRHNFLSIVFVILLSGCNQHTSTMDTNTLDTSSAIESTSLEVADSSAEELDESIISATETTDKKQEVSINDFVGVWGIPNSEEFFVINDDLTYTNPAVKGMPLENLEFGFDDENHPFMSFGNGETKMKFVLEHNGSLTSYRVNYLYFGNYSYDEFIQLENPGEGVKYTESFISSPEEAVESAKYFMTSGNKEEDLENYLFTPSELDTKGRANYSVNVRQKGNEEVHSMAIGRIIVYADNGQCYWAD